MRAFDLYSGQEVEIEDEEAGAELDDDKLRSYQRIRMAAYDVNLMGSYNRRGYKDFEFYWGSPGSRSYDKRT